MLIAQKNFVNMFNYFQFGQRKDLITVALKTVDPERIFSFSSASCDVIANQLSDLDERRLRIVLPSVLELVIKYSLLHNPVYQKKGIDETTVKSAIGINGMYRQAYDNIVIKSGPEAEIVNVREFERIFGHLYN